MYFQQGSVMVVRVCVVGAGVIGLASAIQIQERLSQGEVTIIADSFSPGTTTDGSGGFWKPHLLGETPVEDIRHWSLLTWDHLLEIATSPLAGEVGCSTVSGYCISTKPHYQDEWWKDLVFGYRHLSQQELKMFSSAKSGIFFTSIQINAVMYMAYLLERFKRNGGKVVPKTIHSITEVAQEYDVVVNCCGLAARKLVGDMEVVPVRGHLTRVVAPWVKQFVLKFDPPGEEAFVVPGLTTCNMGGVDEIGSWNTEVREKDKAEAWRRCCQLVPSLQNAKVHNHWVGLRPTRSRVRLEMQYLNVGGRRVPVIHNYGHGGAGVTLHWGCGHDAADLACQEINSRRHLSSKL